MGKVTVLGVGNIILSDEGLGVKALKLLQANYEFIGDIELMDGGTLGIDLLYYLRDTEKLLILDAVRGGKSAGTLYRFEGEAVKKYFSGKVSMHDLGIQEVLALMDMTDDSPSEVVVIGIEPEKLDIGTELSRSVEENIPRLLKESINQIKKWGIRVKKRVVTSEEFLCS